MEYIFIPGEEDISYLARYNLWYDNELLADVVFGAGERPENWFSATTLNRDLLVRNVRHDLELTADEVFNGPIRPAFWQGASPLFRCSRTIQNLVRIIDVEYGTPFTTPVTTPDFCNAVREELAALLLPIAIDQQNGFENVAQLSWWLRGDLERLADELFGVGARPPNWVGNIELGSPTMQRDIDIDLERLASDEFTPDIRPAEWLPFVEEAASTSYINLRNNLEVLTDTILSPEVRPSGWQGITDDPVSQCGPMVQAVFFIAQNAFDLFLDPAVYEAEDFCVQIEAASNDNLENPPRELVEQLDDAYVAEAENAFTYLDIAATEYMGMMPFGTEFRAWYRNFAGSNMMFVSGDNFAVFIDRRWTTMEEDVFNTLDTIEGVQPLAFCDASWCNGPGPTPTPTGASAIDQLLAAVTAPAPGDNTDFTTLEAPKTQVSWNHVRVTYVARDIQLNFRGQVRTGAQVALEICVEPQQITCEPVISVRDIAAGVPIPALFQSNGLNVYQLPYGYTDGLQIEGATLISPDVFLSDTSISS